MSLLFENAVFDDRKLRNLLSRAYVFVQKYISIQFFLDNELKPDNYKAKLYGYSGAIKDTKIE